MRSGDGEQSAPLDDLVRTTNEMDERRVGRRKWEGCAHPTTSPYHDGHVLPQTKRHFGKMCQIQMPKADVPKADAWTASFQARIG